MMKTFVDKQQITESGETNSERPAEVKELAAITGVVEVYRTRDFQSEPYYVSIEGLYTHISLAIYRFWLSERRNPSWIVLPHQLALQIFGSFESLVYGYHENIPIIGRDGDIDPLFQLV